MMAERGVRVDHATVQRWALKTLPILAQVFRRRQVPGGRSWLNHLVEQDHRAIKRRTHPMMGFGSIHTAAKLIAGIAIMHAIKKGQLACDQGLIVSDADRFYSLATR